MGKQANGLKSRFSRHALGLLFGVLLFVPAIGLSAQGYTCQGAKGVYSPGGKDFFFWTPRHQAVEYICGTWDSSGFTVDHSVSWDEFTTGGLGACVFNGAVYAFYTTYNGELRYVKVNGSTGGRLVHATTIASGVSAHGAAAAVFRGMMYVFTASDTFSSKDGTHYTRALSGPDGADAIMDAVTFFPPDDAPPLPHPSVPAAIMVLFSSGGKLQAELFQGADNGFGGGADTLPNPLSYPVAQGNLVLGTSAGDSRYGWAAGAKAACIQFYGTSQFQENGDFEYGRWEYNEGTGHWTAQKWFSGQDYYADAPGLSVAPWFDVIDSTSLTLHLKHFVWDLSDWDRRIGNGSDYLVPTYNDSENGWQGKPTKTYEATVGSKLANLWTLVGVILGPPPFPANGETVFCDAPYERSWVEYKNDSTTEVSVTSTIKSTISIASDSKIEGGLGGLELDLSYAHAWSSSNKWSTSKSISKEYHFGVCDEYDPDNPAPEGIHGYAIYNAPTLVTQRYKIYAYDYSHSDGSGTYVGESVYSTSSGDVYQQSAYFQLQDPSQGAPKGLFTGLRTYPLSTDLMGWEDNVPDWLDGGGGAWTNVFEPSEVLNMPGEQEVFFTESDSTIDSKDNSNSFSVDAGTTLGIGGFNEKLTAGYDTKWSTKTENKSTVTTAVGCQIDVPIPGGDSPSNYVKQYTVQPFWLQAKTANAPWLPTNFSGDLPWCTTWAVSNIQTVGGSQTGMAAPPALASGKVRHGLKKQKDTFEITGGRLAWQDALAGETPLEMTADEFDPRLGASVSLNGYPFPADGGKGKWVRNGDVWKYKTRQGVKHDPFKLALDFASGTWSFSGSSKNLDQAISAGTGAIRVDLGLAGKYGFISRVEGNVNCTWDHKTKKASRQPFGVHLIKGDYDSGTGSGNLVLKGHLPKNTTSYGDVEIRVNGTSVTIPLLSTPDFLKMLDSGGIVKIESEGMTYKINFGKGKWHLHLEGSAFNSEMAPKNGEIRVQVLVGGVTTSDQTFQLSNTRMGLTYAG